MYGDLVCALMGIPGALYGVSGDGFKACVEMRGIEMLPSESERDIIGQLCEIASTYYRLSFFVDKYLHRPTVPESADHASGGGPSIYFSVCAVGLKEVLEPYRSVVKELELTYQKPCGKSLMAFLNAVLPFRVLLENLSNMCSEMEDLSEPGLCVFNVLDKYGRSGVPCMQDACKVLRRHCRSPFIRNLSGWMMLGTGQPRRDDFFVAGRDFELCSTNISFIRGRRTWRDEEMRAPELELNAAQVPYFMKLSAAESVVTLARNVRLLKLFSGTRNNDHWSLLRKQHPEIVKRLDVLNEEDDQVAFNRELALLIEEISTDVDKATTRMVLEDGGLIANCLQVIKDHFLMEKGDLHGAIIRNVHALLRKRRKTRDRSLLQPKVDECVRDQLEMHGRLDVFPEDLKAVVVLGAWDPTRLLAGPDADDDDVDSRGEERWTLRFDVRLPCSLVVSEQQVSHTYQAIYECLVEMRIVQFRLHNLWLRRVKSRKKATRPKDVCVLMEMTFVIRHVLSFFEWFIDENYSAMIGKIHEAARKTEYGALERVQEVHSEFVFSMRTLLNPLFLNRMKKVLDSCSVYCRLLVKYKDGFPDVEDYVRCDAAEGMHYRSVMAFMQLAEMTRSEVSESLKELARQLCANGHMSSKYKTVRAKKMLIV